MPDIFKRALKSITKQTDGDEFYYKNRATKFRPFKKMTKRDLVDLESQLGVTIFGNRPENGRREFFNVDDKTWIWYEEWTDSENRLHEITTRYEIRKDKVVKVQPGPRYKELTGQEMINFKAAVEAYHELVLRRIYREK